VKPTPPGIFPGIIRGKAPVLKKDEDAAKKPETKQEEKKQ
jgi:hypothetical protein